MYHLVYRVTCALVVTSMFLFLVPVQPWGSNTTVVSAAAGSADLIPNPDWAANSPVSSMAWGDFDLDGDLDLAVGNDSRWDAQPLRVYRNTNGVLEQAPVFQSSEPMATTSVAWGDMNNDGYLDLAVGNYNQPTYVYINWYGMLYNDTYWQTGGYSNPVSMPTTGLAWGDMNNDGYLELALANTGVGKNNQVYLNSGGVLQDTPAWQAFSSDNLNSVNHRIDKRGHLR